MPILGRRLNARNKPMMTANNRSPTSSRFRSAVANIICGTYRVVGLQNPLRRRVVESEPTTEIGHQTPRSAMLLLATSQAFIRDSPGDRYVIMRSRYLLNHVIVQSSQVTITRNRTVTERLFVHSYGEFWPTVLPNSGQCQGEMI